MRQSSGTAILVGLTTALFLPLVQAEVRLPAVISSHMVLQQGMPVPIWGSAAPGEKVIVTFRTQRKETVADAAGHWKIKLDSLSAGGPDSLVVAGKNTITLDDVLVGEVWLGSGQSNMAGDIDLYLKITQWSKGDAALAKAVEAAPYPQIRIFKSDSSPWEIAGGPGLHKFSAHLFAFGCQLQRELQVPVGLVLSAVGGTPASGWVSEPTFSNDPACQAALARFRATDNPEVQRQKSEAALATGESAVAKARVEGKPEPPKPAAIQKPEAIKGGKLGHLYDRLIRPLAPYGIRGVLWDQGEAFTGIMGLDQFTLMGTLIRGWRQDWGQGDFPFIYAQKPTALGCAWDPNDPLTSRLASFAAQPKEIPADGPFRRDDGTFGCNGFYRENFIKIMTYPNTAMAIASDLDFSSSGHPHNKWGYGARAVRVALGAVYGRPVEYYGPLYQSCHLEDGKMRIAFTHVGKGLAVRHSDRLQGFMIAGDDRKFVWANARIDGDSVIVSSDRVAHPAAVRYAWSKAIRWANLFNQDGLPALTFRTDDWSEK